MTIAVCVPPIGDVSETYQSQLTLGRQSLEIERNLFYASIASGRRIEISDAVRLGDALWWVRRSPLNTDDPALARIAIELQCEMNGWRVYLITLPESANSEEMASLSLRLQRRVRPARPRVWIESPGLDGSLALEHPLQRSLMQKVERFAANDDYPKNTAQVLALMIGAAHDTPAQ